MQNENYEYHSKYSDPDLVGVVFLALAWLVQA
jgi:hypothetical protein